MRIEFYPKIKKDYFIIPELPENNFPPKIYLLPKQSHTRFPPSSDVELKSPKQQDPFETLKAELRAREERKEREWKEFLARKFSLDIPKQPDPFKTLMAELRAKQEAEEAEWQAILAKLLKPEPWIKTLLPPNKDFLPIFNSTEKIEPRRTKTQLDPFTLALSKQKYRP